MLLLSHISVAFRSNLVYFGFFFWSNWSTSIYFVHFSPFWSTSLYFILLWSILVKSFHIVRYGHTLEKCLICNNFTTNLSWQAVIGSNLGLSLMSLFYPLITTCCLRFVIIIIRQLENLKT